MSCQPCGCDPEAKHECERHQRERWPATAEPSDPVDDRGAGLHGRRVRAETQAFIQQVTLHDPLMAEAFDLTTRDRHNQYGSALEAFRAYGHIWTGLLAHKLKSGAVIEPADVALMMTGLKIAREVRSSKRDNVVDAHGYLSILARIRGWLK